MKSHINFLVLVFVVLSLALLLTWKFQQPKKMAETSALLTGTVDQINSFALNNFTLGLLFTKENDQWFVQRVKNDLVKDLETKSTGPIVDVDENPLPAKTEDVDALLSTLFAAKDLELISTTAGENNVFEINKFSLHVILYNKNLKEIERIFFGKQGPEPGTLFVKRANSPNVFLMGTDPRLMLLKKYEEWLLTPPSTPTEKKTDGKTKK